MKKNRTPIKRESLIRFSSSVVAILGGLLVGLIILLITNPRDAFGGFIMILLGGFSGGMRGIGQVLYIATPIMMTGLAVGFAFKTGLFNIGASGQFIMGAYFALLVSIRFTFLPESVHWIVAVIAAAIGGALWALIPGILKAYYNVHEVISTIMMNYIGMYLANYLVTITIYNSLKNQSLDPIAVIPRIGLDTIFAGSSAHGGIILAVIIAVIIYIILNKTTFGYELKACGVTMEASKYAGINEKRGIVLSMVIAGALAGIGGSFLYLARTGKSIEVIDKLAPEGFAGISVALLGLSNPIGIVFSSVFIAHITQGGFYAQRLNFKPEIIEIMTAVIIYFSAFSLMVKMFFNKREEKRKINADKADSSDIIKDIESTENEGKSEIAGENPEKATHENRGGDGK